MSAAGGFLGAYSTAHTNVPFHTTNALAWTIDTQAPGPTSFHTSPYPPNNASPAHRLQATS